MFFFHSFYFIFYDFLSSPKSFLLLLLFLNSNSQKNNIWPYRLKQANKTTTSITFTGLCSIWICSRPLWLVPRLVAVDSNLNVRIRALVRNCHLWLPSARLPFLLRRFWFKTRCLETFAGFDRRRLLVRLGKRIMLDCVGHLWLNW